MKNIILQHFTGTLGELESLSIKNISSYAERIGVEYRFISGNVFRPDLYPPCQKLIMLDEMFDDYDYVCMMDADMFAVKNLNLNVFTDISGTGLYCDYLTSIHNACVRRFPDLCDIRYAYWGGCLWRLSKSLRTQFRGLINDSEISRFSGPGNFNDEGIMHRLATLAKYPQDSIPESWSYSHYLPHPENAHIIHIRPKVTFTGPKCPKIENYHRLRDRGILE